MKTDPKTKYRQNHSSDKKNVLKCGTLGKQRFKINSSWKAGGKVQMFFFRMMGLNNEYAITHVFQI